MRLRALIGALVLVGLTATQGMGSNLVWIYWDEPVLCDPVYRVNIRISNDVPLRSLTVPLIVRNYWRGSVTVQLSFDNRLAGSALSDVRESQLLFTQDGTCQSSGAAGFATVDFNDTFPHTVPGTPIGVLFHCATLGSDFLPAGQEDYPVTGSLGITFAPEYPGGLLEIDTTCTDPANHLLFVDASDNAFAPALLLSISHWETWCYFHGDLDLDGFVTPLDMGIEIDYLFAGGSVERNPYCAVVVDPADFNCDGWADAIDLSELIDHLFAGGHGPCNPMFDCYYCGCELGDKSLNPPVSVR